MLHKIKVKLLKMSRKIKVFRSYRNYKNKISKLKSIERFNGRINVTKERIRKLEDKSIEIIQSKEKEGKTLTKHKLSLRPVKQYQNILNVCHCSPRRRRESRVEKQFLYGRNFWNLVKDINL